MDLIASVDIGEIFSHSPAILFFTLLPAIWVNAYVIEPFSSSPLKFSISMAQAESYALVLLDLLRWTSVAPLALFLDIFLVPWLMESLG